MGKSLFLILSMWCLLPVTLWAQTEKEVHGEATYTVGLNDNITFYEVRHRCIELAQADAIKSGFGELVTSDIIENQYDNGDEVRSVFWENTIAKAKGRWLENVKEPEFSVSYSDNKLTFKAEVWGIAREIIQAQTDLKWNVLTVNGRETDEFKSGDRVIVKFRAPADGYVAIYLITGDDKTSCLLPYKQNSTGQHFIRRNIEYLFFDKEIDEKAVHYTLNTQHEVERNQLVIIYSPNPFTKCNDTTGDKRHANSLSTHDFQKWLLNCQRDDKDMIVNKKWIRILKK